MRKNIYILLSLLLILSACRHPSEDRDVNLNDFLTLSRDIQNSAEIYEVNKPITINYSVTPNNNNEFEIVVPKDTLRPIAVREGYLEGKINQEVLLYQAPQTDNDDIAFISFNTHNNSEKVKNSMIYGFHDRITLSYLNNTSGLFDLLSGNHVGKVREGIEELVKNNKEIILPVVDNLTDLKGKNNKPTYVKFARFGTLKVDTKENGKGNGNNQFNFYATFLGYYTGNTNNKHYETADLTFEETFPSDFEIKASDITGLENVSVENNVVRGKLSIKYIEKNNKFTAERRQYNFAIKVTPKKIDDYTLNKATISMDNEDLKDTQNFNPLSISVKGIEIVIPDSDISLNVGDSKKINVEYRGSVDIIQKKIWESSDPSIVEVSDDGTIHALKRTEPGEKVTVTLVVEHRFGKIEKKISVEVIKLAESINTDRDTIKLKVGQEYSLDNITVTVGPQDATYKDYSWDEESDTYLTFKDNHTIIGDNPGETKIVVRPNHAINDNVFKEIKVIVYVPLDSINFDPDKMTMEKGETINLNEFIEKNPAISIEQITNISFASNNKYLAIVDSTGKVTAKRIGKVTITLKAKSESGKDLEADLEIDIVKKKSADSHKNDGDLY